MTVELIHGDCLDVLRSIGYGRFDCVIADPPYGTTACKWDAVIPFAPMWEALLRVAKPSAAIVLFAAQPFTSALVMSNPRLFRYDWMWDKYTPTGYLNARFMPMKAHESIAVFARGKTTYNPQKFRKPYKVPKGNDTKRMLTSGVYGVEGTYTTHRDDYAYPKSVLSFPTGGGWDKRHNVHPTQKPVDLCAYLVRTYTNPGDTVLDFCMGSGTTGVACVQEGRRFVGIEKDAGYFEVAMRRIEAERAQLALPLGAD